MNLSIKEIYQFFNFSNSLYLSYPCINNNFSVDNLSLTNWEWNKFDRYLISMKRYNHLIQSLINYRSIPYKVILSTKQIIFFLSFSSMKLMISMKRWIAFSVLSLILIQLFINVIHFIGEISSYSSLVC